MLLAAGAAVDAPRLGNWAALHLAACSGQAEVVRLLLAAGASLGAGRQGVETALALAAEHAVHTGDSATSGMLVQHIRSAPVPAEALVTAATVAASKRSCYGASTQASIVEQLLLLAVEQDAHAMVLQSIPQRAAAAAALQQQLSKQPRCAGLLVTSLLLNVWLQSLPMTSGPDCLNQGAASAGYQCATAADCDSLQHMLVDVAAALQDV
jgi:hypothetical protein